MWEGVYPYMVGLAGLGGASGIDLVAKQRGIPLTGGVSAIAAVCGIVDVLALLAAFFIFSFEPALAAVLVGSAGSVILAKVLPDAPGIIVLLAGIGIIGFAISMFG